MRVFRALVGAAPQGMTPSALVALLDIPASTLSFHLKELVHAQLVNVERDGRSLIYRPELARMNALLGYLTDHCCQGSPCAGGDCADAACEDDARGGGEATIACPPFAGKKTPC